MVLGGVATYSGQSPCRMGNRTPHRPQRGMNMHAANECIHNTAEV